MNSLHGKRSPFGARATKHLPPPQGEISHIRRRAVGARMERRIFEKLATGSLLPVSSNSSHVRSRAFMTMASS